MHLIFCRKDMPNISSTERPIEVVEPLKNVTGQEKASATLSCRLSAVPKEVCWFKGQTVLEASSKYLMKQSAAEVQLVIQTLSPGDDGEYRCHVGTCETKATLTVEGEILNCFLLYCFKIFVLRKGLRTELGNI